MRQTDRQTKATLIAAFPTGGDLYSTSSRSCLLICYRFPYVGADLRLISPQPDISQHCETAYIGYCITQTAPTYGEMARAKQTWVSGSALMWFAYPKMVTHPDTNRALHRVTTLIETNTVILAIHVTAMSQLA